MLEKNMNTFLKDITSNSKVMFLEEGKNDDELTSIAEEFNIVMPSIDLAIFKCVYAYVDKENLNGCTLTKDEVEKALPTLAGKAIDFDHIRKQVVGHWLKGMIDGDTIVAYGLFYKSNFGDDYEVIRKLFDNGTLAISFEAWGDKEYKDDGSYNLNNVCFAGGALLLKTTPAFPGSEVLEMSNKERILEFAKVMVEPDEYIHSNPSKKIDTAQYYSWEMDTISTQLYKIVCPECQATGYIEILMIDFEESLARVKCYECESLLIADLIPRTVKIPSSGSYIKEIRVDETTNGGKKMEEKLMELQKVVASLEEQMKTKDSDLESRDAEIAKLNEDIKAIKDELEEAKTSLNEAKSLEESFAERVDAEVEKREKISTRRSELTEEYAKDMSDDDILDESKFEKAKLLKENTELKINLEKAKKGELEEASDSEDEDMEIASAATGKKTVKDIAQRVRERAWGGTLDEE